MSKFVQTLRITTKSQSLGTIPDIKTGQILHHLQVAMTELQLHIQHLQLDLRLEIGKLARLEFSGYVP